MPDLRSRPPPRTATSRCPSALARHRHDRRRSIQTDHRRIEPPTQFVLGHVHLKDLGQLACREIEAAGGVAKEFNTIAVDDGIAMGHDGMLASLLSRISCRPVEYMVNAHCADALVCISNCDKITPGMLMAAMRLNIPTIFVTGGPMEAGKTKLAGVEVKLDLIDPMIKAGDTSVSDEDVQEMERRPARPVGRVRACSPPTR